MHTNLGTGEGALRVYSQSQLSPEKEYVISLVATLILRNKWFRINLSIISSIYN
jgi:hypothetical protein